MHQTDIEGLQNSYTEKLSRKLIVSRFAQKYEPLVIWDGHSSNPIKMVLILQLNKSYIHAQPATTVYSSNYHILAKAFKLLVHIEETTAIFDTISSYNVRSIIVTTASAPQYMNQSNKWVLETQFAKTTTRQLITLKLHSQDIYEAAIKSLVDENR